MIAFTVGRCDNPRWRLSVFLQFNHSLKLSNRFLIPQELSNSIATNPRITPRTNLPIKSIVIIIAFQYLKFVN